MICPVCNSPNLSPFLFREQFSVSDNLLFTKKEDAININKGNLNIVYCEDCGLVFNQEFDQSKIDYGRTYEYNVDKHFSPTFNQHLEDVINYLVFEKGVQNKNVVEIGCGTGSFLKKLIGLEQFGNRGYGFDTSYTGDTNQLEGKVTFEKTYYGPDSSHIPADVVIFRHVLEHIIDPVYFLEEIRRTLINSPHAKIFCEVPCVEWILQNQVFWDFYYEHCMYFSSASLKTAFEKAGFQVDTVKHIYYGQFLWLEATIPEQKPAITKQVGSIPNLVQDFSRAETHFKQNWQNKIKALVAQGEKIVLWGAAARGTTFLNLIDPDNQNISAVVDMNPKKQGTFISRTGHPIISYEKLKQLGITYAIVLNRNFVNEIKALLHENNLNIKVIEDIE